MEAGYIIFFGIYAFIIIMSVGLSFTSTFGNHSSKWKTDEDGSMGEVPIELKLIRAFHEFLYYTGNFAIALGLWKGIWNG
ncbi:MAG: hypothetical protein MK236_00375, partial [Pedosphaera sp.]|nr:hypothetical protein [Pedosphaera sp.]